MRTSLSLSFSGGAGFQPIKVLAGSRCRQAAAREEARFFSELDPLVNVGCLHRGRAARDA
jgi:hypothetical protein